jgi:phage/plasmid-associated DNA primase
MTVQNFSEMTQSLKTKSRVNTTKIDDIDFYEYSKQYINTLNVATLYEVIKGNPVKAYFDYDQEVKSQLKLTKLRNKAIKLIYQAMKEYFNQGEQIDIFDASGYNPVKEIWKLSFRVIIQNGCLYPNGLYIKDVILPQIKKKIKYFDESVYKAQDKLQLLLMPYHHKEGNENRFFQKVNLDDDNYPLIEKKDISLREFITYSVQSQLKTNCDESKLKLMLGNESDDDSKTDDDTTDDDTTDDDTTDDDTTDDDTTDDKKQKPKSNKPTKSKDDKKQKPKNDDDDDDEDEDDYHYSLKDIEELCNCLNYEKQEWDWEFWTHLMWCLSNMSMDYDIDLLPLAHKISGESKKYDKKFTKITYNQSRRKDGEHRLAIGSLIEWCKEFNPKGVKLWQVNINKNRLLQFMDEETYNNIQFILSSYDFTDGDGAELFCEIHENKLIYSQANEQMYYFNGVYWENITDDEIYNKMESIYQKLNRLAQHLFKKERLVFLKKIQKFRSYCSRKSIFGCIKSNTIIKNDLFDKKENLLGFTNGTYELDNGLFREAKRDDYLTKIIPYDFAECEAKDIEFVENHFKEVLPDPEIRDLFFITTATGLRGRVLQHFIIWTGVGANSKGVSAKIVRTALGDDLYYKGNNCVLTQEVKGDLCVGISAMNDKRLVLYEEPSDKKKIITNMMKELTGGDTMAYRGLYSGNMKTNMRATHIMMCNDRPLLDKVDQAVNRRLIMIPFDSQFVKQDVLKDLPEGAKNVFIGKDGIEDKEFLEYVKLPFLHILLRYYQVFKNNGYQIINIPQRCKDMVKEYLQESDDFTAWFNDVFELTNDDKDFLKMSDVYTMYKNSELYQNLDKKTRRLKGSKKAIISDIQKNPTLRMYFRERYDRRIDGQDVSIKNCIIRHKVKIEDDDEIDEVVANIEPLNVMTRED